ncbi:MAG: hypothetical protein IH838_06085, partial [Proteobacteria bacterium]|nr:hypothetical protein [Pseudomonadota bacterium]
QLGADVDPSSPIDILDRIFSFLDNHFLGLSILLVVFGFRKGIGGLLQRVTKLFFNAPGGYAGGINAAPPTPELAQADRSREAKSAEPGERISEEKQQEEAEEKQSLWDAHQAIASGDLEKATEIFDALQRDVDDADAKHSNEAFFLHDLYTDGASEDALKRLEQLHERSRGDAQIETSTQWLAFCYAAAKDYKKEERTWTEGIAAVRNDAAKTNMIEGLAHLYKRNGETERGIQLLEERLKELDDDAQRASIYSNLASMDKEIGREDDAAIALEKSIEHSPGDRDRLFSAAYLQSERDLTLLSIANYQTLIQIDPNHDTALNNLGVCAGELSLGGKKIALYGRALEHGSTLAMANLANAQINAGLWEDAEKTLDEARKKDKPHENIGHAIYRLQSRRKSEIEEWLGFGKRASEFQRKVREYGDALFDRSDAPVSFAGKWYTQKGDEVTIKNDNGRIHGEWVEQRGFLGNNTFNCSIDGIVRNRAARVTYRSSDASKLVPSILSDTTPKTVKCLSYLSTDAETWMFFSTQPSDQLAFELRRSIPED